MENDTLMNTDFDYTHGVKISLLYYRGDTSNSIFNIPFTSHKDTNNFISFAYANHMYTPYDLCQTQLIKDDRPYAGYSYLEFALHQSSKTNLDSLTLEIGNIGPQSKINKLQDKIHKALNAKDANGWDNQLKNEIIIQLNYMHKWRLQYENFYGYNSILTPYAGFDLGNRSIRASGGGLYRIGHNIPSDFGYNTIKEGSFSSMPTNSKTVINDSSNYSAYLNFALGSSFVVRDIFLDGNSFKNSHSVDKKPLIGFVSTGVTLRYKSFALDLFHTYYTKDFKDRGKYKKYKGFSSFTLTYYFE